MTPAQLILAVIQSSVSLCQSMNDVWRLSTWSANAK